MVSDSYIDLGGGCLGPMAEAEDTVLLARVEAGQRYNRDCCGFCALGYSCLERGTRCRHRIIQINQIGGLALISGLVGVFVEELLFRGVMQTSLSEIARPWLAILIAAVLFLLIHVPGWVLLKLPIDAQIVGSVFAIGVICGVLRHLTQSIWPPIAAHWANNLGALF